MIGSKRGMVLFVLLCILTIVSISAFSLNKFAQQKLRQNKQLLDRQSCNILAQSALNYAVANLQEELENQPSSVADYFFNPELQTGTIVPLPLPMLNDLVAEYSDSEAQIQVKTISIRKMQKEEEMSTSGYDPLERSFEVEFTAFARTGLITCNLTETREIRLVNLQPGLAGKFTLFVKNIKNPDSFNKFPCHIDGFPDSTFAGGAVCNPVILKNGGELDFAASEIADSNSWKKRGYIFLGGSDVTLNLTSGNFEAYGELFHFFSMESESQIPGYFDIIAPSFFSPPPDFKAKWPQTLNTGEPFASSFAYILKHVLTGFYTTQDDGSNMNHDRRLELSFPSNQANSIKKMQSSSLHLFGTRSNPSPTLVLGNVSRRYADFTGIVVDVDGDGSRDAIVDYVRETNAEPGAIAPPPEEIYAVAGGALSPGTPIRLDQDLLNYGNMFNSAPIYQENMCKLITEPYLRSHDFMYFSSEESFFPSKSCFGEEAASFQNDFSLKFNSNLMSDKYFYRNGNPKNFSDNGFKHKLVYRISSFDDFLSRFYDKNTSTLDLQIPVIVENTGGQPVKLPGNIKINNCGMLVIEKGDLELGAIEQQNFDSCLTIILFSGNFVLNNPQQQTIGARLIALQGQLKNLSPVRALDLLGGLVVGDYEPEEFKSGGRIIYDDRADPSGEEYKEFYRCYVADYPLLTVRKTSLQSN